MVASTTDYNKHRAGLCSTKDAKLIQRTLEFSRTDVMDQDVFYFYANLANNIDARRIVFEDTLTNWQSVRKYPFYPRLVI